MEQASNKKTPSNQVDGPTNNGASNPVNNKPPRGDSRALPLGDGPANDTVTLQDINFAWQGQPSILQIEQLNIARQEKVFLMGPSGSGKSTLLGLLGGVLEAQSGRVQILGQDLCAMSKAKRDSFRAEHIGIIFQMFNLLPFLSLIENVTLPCRFSSRRRAAINQNTANPLQDEAKRLLAHMGLVDESLFSRPVRNLSVGQQQRVAAARALIGQPEILIADEPTSALDVDARGAFLDLLLGECSKSGTTLIFVSHDKHLGGHFDRILDLTEINHAYREGQ